ncbi:MAG: YbaN family protein [Pseudomonadota bacterium]
MNTKLKNYLLIFAGWLSIILGVIGVVVPLLPTTPFILLAAACFAKSSPKFHHWLITHKFFGPIIKNFQNGEGLPKKTKIKIIIFIWVALSISMFALSNLWITLILVMIGLFGTAHILRTPTSERELTNS